MDKIKKYYFDLDGRIGRADYIIRIIIATIVLGVLSFLNVMLIAVHQIPPIAVALGGIIVIASVIISIVLMAKRLHDLDKTGWLSLLIFVPVVGFILFVVLLVIPGTAGPNNYGQVQSG